MRLTGFGDPPTFELQELPDPKPGAGEVVVALRAAALNRRDPWIWQTPDYCPLPVTLGSDGAGVVAEVGSSVTEWSVGDEVVFDPTLHWGESEEHPTEDFDILGAPSDGTFAERVVVTAESVARKPPRLGWHEAAAINLAGLTAWRATVTCAGAGEGKTLLVTGAGSGVATFVVQIGVARGASVYVTTSSMDKLERLRDLGAAGGVLYTEPEWPAQLRELVPEGLNAAVDSAGGPSWEGALAALRKGGTLVSFGDTAGEHTTIATSEVYWQWRRIVGTSMGSPREYRAMLAHVASAAWRPVIDSVFALEDLDAAARRLAAPDRFGKIVLEI